MIITEVKRMRHTQTKPANNQYISNKDRAQLIKEVGDSAAILFHYYFDKGGYHSYDYKDDKKTALVLGWNERKVARERYKLEKNNWILKKTYSHRDGSKYQITLMGKSAVTKHLNEQTHSLSNLCEDSSITPKEMICK